MYHLVILTIALRNWLTNRTFPLYWWANGGSERLWLAQRHTEQNVLKSGLEAEVPQTSLPTAAPTGWGTVSHGSRLLRGYSGHATSQELDIQELLSVRHLFTEWTFPWRAFRSWPMSRPCRGSVLGGEKPNSLGGRTVGGARSHMQFVIGLN